MKYDLFDSVDEMLAPTTMSSLMGRTIRKTHISPMIQLAGISGSQFMWVTTDDTSAPRYVMKQMRMEWDWIMQATNDYECRAIRLWRSGALDRLSPEIDHGIIACARDGDGWAMLMYDLSDKLLPLSNRLERPVIAKMLYSLAVLHARYWEAPELHTSDLSLCNIQTMVEVTLPKTHRSRFGALAPAFSNEVVGGLTLFEEAFGTELAALLHSLATDPQPLYRALLRYPQTLLHGDFQCYNLANGHAAGARTTVLDWQIAAAGPPTLDLTWYIGFDYPSPGSPENCISAYRRNLSSALGDRFDEKQWQSMLALGILTTAVRQSCPAAWQVMHGSNEWREAFRQKLPWWSRQIHAATKWL